MEQLLLRCHLLVIFLSLFCTAFSPGGLGPRAYYISPTARTAIFADVATEMAAINAEMLAKREEKELGRNAGGVTLMTRVPQATACAKAQAVC